MGKRCRYGIAGVLCVVCLMFGGCGGLSDEISNEILDCVEEAGYIGENDTYLYVISNISSPIPKMMSRDYIYTDGTEKYGVRIHTPSEDEGPYEVTLLYGIEVEENIRTQEGRQYIHRRIANITDTKEFWVVRKTMLFGDRLEVVEAG